MRTNPQRVEVLLGNYRRKVLGLVLLRPDETFHGREIGRYQVNRRFPILEERAGVQGNQR